LQRIVERPWTARLVLLLWCGFLFFHGLNAGDLYRTESLRAIIAAEFLHSGNWIVPTLYGQPLLTKPPGMYIAIALVSLPFGGVSTWTARLPSALAALATVLIVFWYFRRQLGQPGGLLAALLLPMSFMWLDKATAAEIDMLHVFWVTAAILCFLRALEEEDRVTESGLSFRASLSQRETINRNEKSVWWLLALLCVAGGVLTKWTAPVFFYGTVIPLLWWRGRLRLLWGRYHLIAAVVGASVCLAWMTTVIAMVGWETFSDTVSREALQRLSPSHHQEVQQSLAPHHQPHLYPWAEVLVHPLRILASSLPWSALALVTLWPGFMRLWDAPRQRLLQALHCWTWPNLIFWSVIPDHAPRHSFPLFPGIAGLAAMVAMAWLTGRMRWPLPRLQPRRVLLGTLLLWMVVKLVFVHAVVPRRNVNRQPRAKGELLGRVVPTGRTLYLFRLKDEGIMFYYGRPVQRLESPANLPSSGEPVYCILELSEWQQWHSSRPGEVVLHLRDEQQARIVLVRVLS
jgi:4-amino-4-deoxy-L-arabinose transferase-like glycosyltransferase